MVLGGTILFALSLVSGPIPELTPISEDPRGDITSNPRIGPNPPTFNGLLYPTMRRCQATSESMSEVLRQLSIPEFRSRGESINMSVMLDVLYSSSAQNFKIIDGNSPPQFPYWNHPNPTVLWEQGPPQAGADLTFKLLPGVTCETCIAFLTVEASSYCFVFKISRNLGGSLPKDPDGVLIAGGFDRELNTGEPKTRELSYQGVSSDGETGPCASLRHPRSSPSTLFVVVLLSLAAFISLRRRLDRSAEKTVN